MCNRRLAERIVVRALKRQERSQNGPTEQFIGLTYQVRKAKLPTLRRCVALRSDPGCPIQVVFEVKYWRERV